MDQPVVVEPCVQPHRIDISLRAIWLCAFAASLVLYAATVAPDVLMMDSGEYHIQTWLFPHVESQGLNNLVRIHFNYLALAKAFGLLVPIGNWFLRMNLFSALMAGLAVGNACALTYVLTRSRAATALAWLTLALGQTFWQYAVISEVLSLQAATISAELLVLYLWATSGTFRWLVLLWTINGLAAGAHVQNGLATPVYMVVTILAWRQGRVSLRQAALCAGLWLAGFTPFLAYCLHQLHTHDGWHLALGSVTVGSYGRQVFQFSAKVLLKGLLSIGLNYPTGLALLALPGLVLLVRNRAPGTFRVAWLAVLGANLLFAMTYAVPDQQSFFVPIYPAAAPLIGLGAAAVLRSRTDWAVAFVLGLLVVPVYAALPRIVRHPRIAPRLPLPQASQVPYRDPYEFYLKPWKTGRHNERRYVEEVLGALPPDAAFYCSSTAREALRAVQLVESRRHDVVLNPPAETLADRLRPGSRGSVEWVKPVYLWAPDPKTVPRPIVDHCRIIERGTVWEVLPPEHPESLIADLKGQSGVGG